MKRLFFFATFVFLSVLSYCQEGVVYIRSSSTVTTNYPLVIKDTGGNELHFTLASDSRKEVGIYRSEYELGFWNAENDTFALNDSLLVVFINPFPDVVLTTSVPEMPVEGKPYPVGIGEFIYVKSIDGKYISKCLQKNEKGTMIAYFDDDESIVSIAYYSKGKLTSTEEFIPHTLFMNSGN